MSLIILDVTYLKNIIFLIFFYNISYFIGFPNKLIISKIKYRIK